MRYYKILKENTNIIAKGVSKQMFLNELKKLWDDYVIDKNNLCPLIITGIEYDVGKPIVLKIRKEYELNIFKKIWIKLLNKIYYFSIKTKTKIINITYKIIDWFFIKYYKIKY